MFCESFVQTRQPSSLPAARRPRSALATSFHEPSASEVAVDTLVLNGLEARLLRIHVRLEPGPAVLAFPGIEEARARETRVRLVAALRALGRMPAGTVTVRFAPGRPETRGMVPSAANDAAVALGVLLVASPTDLARLRGTAILGALSLDGSLRGVRGALPMARGAAALGLTRLIVPRANGAEAALASGLRVEVMDGLPDLVCHLAEGRELEGATGAPSEAEHDPYDLADLHGMENGRRALEIAAAGGHGLLVTGPPGCGKSVLARRLPRILPAVSEAEALDITSIHSAAGLLRSGQGLTATRPFRAPHSSVSAAGLLGGGHPARLGEVTLAHHGVLLLDDAPEFRASVLDWLRSVLRDRGVLISRAGARTRLPAEALLVATSNLCPCGRSGTDAAGCTCSPARVALYRTCLERSLGDLLDLRVEVRTPDAASRTAADPGDTSVVVRARVTRARSMQGARAREFGTPTTNAMLTPGDLGRVAMPDADGMRAFLDATKRLGLAEAAADRVLRVARTIADLAERDTVSAAHILEALAFTGCEAAGLVPSAAARDHAA